MSMFDLMPPMALNKMWIPHAHLLKPVIHQMSALGHKQTFSMLAEHVRFRG